MGKEKKVPQNLCMFQDIKIEPGETMKDIWVRQKKTSWFQKKTAEFIIFFLQVINSPKYQWWIETFAYWNLTKKARQTPDHQSLDVQPKPSNDRPLSGKNPQVWGEQNSLCQMVNFPSCINPNWFFFGQGAKETHPESTLQSISSIQLLPKWRIGPVPSSAIHLHLHRHHHCHHQYQDETAQICLGCPARMNFESTRNLKHETSSMTVKTDRPGPGIKPIAGNSLSRRGRWW